jgi:hypothetical protein
VSFLPGKIKMASGKIPGSICGYRNIDNINDGTSCLRKSPFPGSLGYVEGNPGNWDHKGLAPQCGPEKAKIDGNSLG